LFGKDNKLLGEGSNPPLEELIQNLQNQVNSLQNRIVQLENQNSDRERNLNLLSNPQNTPFKTGQRSELGNSILERKKDHSNASNDNKIHSEAREPEKVDSNLFSEASKIPLKPLSES